MVELFGNTDCLGTREVIKVHKEKQANGRVFEKVNAVNCSCTGIRMYRTLILSQFEIKAADSKLFETNLQYFKRYF